MKTTQVSRLTLLSLVSSLAVIVMLRWFPVSGDWASLVAASRFQQYSPHSVYGKRE